MEALSLHVIGPGSVDLPDGVDVPGVASGVIASTQNLYDRKGFIVPWVGYLAVIDGKCVGTCAFTGPPENGEVELAYFTFPAEEGKGIGTAMARKLVNIALQSRGKEISVIAHTLPLENASTRILKKVGFRYAGEILHEEDGKVWKWVHM